MAKEIKTQIRIHASPEKIWSILTGFKHYPEWNPFIQSISGEPEPGKTLQVFIAPPGKKGMALRPEVLVAKPGKEFRWKGKLLVPGLFDGEHIFELESHSDGSTTFTQRELFNGILIPFFTKMLDIHTVKGFELMNLKLKERAEAS